MVFPNNVNEFYYFIFGGIMKTVERIIIKIVIIQFIFLLISQVFFHKMNAFPELKEITQYEGVTDNNFAELLETFNESTD